MVVGTFSIVYKQMYDRENKDNIFCVCVWMVVCLACDVRVCICMDVIALLGESSAQAD